MQSRERAGETDQPAEIAATPLKTGTRHDGVGNAAMTAAFAVNRAATRSAGLPPVMAARLPGAAGNSAVARLLGGAPAYRCGSTPCTDCDEQEWEDASGPAVHRFADGPGAAGPPDAFVNALSGEGSGTPLTQGFLAQAGDRFGADFSAVRVHTGPDAASAAEIISARAFTIGSDIYFAPGEYQPMAYSGQRLLAHELTHVLQGGGPQASGTSGASGSWVSRPTDPAELEAEATAGRFMAGGGVTIAGSAGVNQVRRDGPQAPAPPDTSAIQTAVRNDDVATVVAQLSTHGPEELTAIRAQVDAAIGTRLERWLLDQKIAGNDEGDVERGLRMLWPSLTLMERLQVYDEGWRELEQAQLDVIRAASVQERAAARDDPGMTAVYAAMDAKEEFDARVLMDPSDDSRYRAMQQLLERAPGFFHDDEDEVFDGILELKPTQRRRFYDANHDKTESLFSADRNALFRYLCYGTEAQALIARLQQATEGRIDDMTAVQQVVDRAIALLNERAGLRAALAAGTVPAADRPTVEARVAELNDLDTLLRFDRGGDGQLDSQSFMGMLAAARGDGGAFAADTRRLGQSAGAGTDLRQFAFENAKQRILMSGGDVDAIRSAIMGLHAPAAPSAPAPSAPAPGAAAAAGPSATGQAADEQFRQQLLADDDVKKVLDGLTEYERMRVTDALTADAFVETKDQLNQALNGGDWGTFFRLVMTIARNPEWSARFQAGGTDPLDTFAHVSGEQREIMLAILADPHRVPLDALLAFSGDADVLATAASGIEEGQRGRLRKGYFLSVHPPIGPLSTEQTAYLEEYRQFETMLSSRGAWYRIGLHGAEYQRVLWAVLGQEPTADELATGEGRYLAAELMYQEQQAQLGLDPGAAAGFTETTETMRAAGREFAARFEPMRAAGTLTMVDFAALSTLHDRFRGREAEAAAANDRIGEIAAMVAATVAGIAVVAATGGTATPAVIAMAAASGAGAQVVTREMMGGDYYDPASDQGVRDAILGAVNGALAVTGSALAARGAELLGFGGQALATGAARVGSTVAEQATEAAVQAAPTLARRVAAGSVEAALDGMFSGAASEAANAMTDAATWRRGVWAGLVRVGEAALAAGLVGLATGGLIGAALPVAGAGLGRLGDALLGQSAERTLERAGLASVLADARTAAANGDLAGVNRLLRQMQEHLSAEEESALRTELYDQLRAATGHPPGTATATDSAQQRLLDESAAIADGTALRHELLDAELDVVARSEPQPATVEGYVDEVDLGNGHTWRRREDNTWCRFSSPSLCGTTIPGARAMSQEALDHLATMRSNIAGIRARMDATRLEAEALPGIIRKLQQNAVPGQTRINLDALNAEEREVLEQVFPDHDLETLTLREVVAGRGIPGADLAKLYAAEEAALDDLADASLPLYERMRARTPSGRARDVVLGRGNVDEFSRLPPPSGSLDVDHVYPLRRIVDMPGFAQLDIKAQREIINDPQILRGVDSSMNRSRGDRLWSEAWPGRSQYDAAALARAEADEARVIAYLQEQIRARGAGR